MLSFLSISCLPTRANSSEWTTTTAGGTWSVSSNWGGGVIPGSTSSTTNTDTAIFNVNGNGGTITIDKVGQNIGSIIFASQATSAIGTASGNALLLSSGGSIIDMASLSGFIAPVLNAPLVLEPASSTSNGVYTFLNDDYGTGNPAVLAFGGSISGGSTTGSITLNLTGIGNIGSTTTGTITGAISNGGAAGGLGISVAAGIYSYSTWILSGNNTYTGNTTVNSGTLLLKGTMSSGSKLVMNGGAFTDSSSSIFSTQTVNGLAVNSGLSTVNASPGQTLNLGAITQNAGSMVIFNGSGMTGTITTSNTGFLGPGALTDDGVYYAVGGGGSSAISAYMGGTAANQTNLSNMTNSSVNYTYSPPGDNYTATLTGDITGNTLDTASGASPTINLGGYTMTVNGMILDSTNITGAGSIVIGSSNQLYLYGLGGATSVISSVISGTGTLVIGGGVELTGNNTYSGGTIINGLVQFDTTGTFSTSSPLGTGTITLSNGAELENVSNPSGVQLVRKSSVVSYWYEARKERKRV